jgi:hypothetical protein
MACGGEPGISDVPSRSRGGRLGVSGAELAGARRPPRPPAASSHRICSNTGTFSEVEPTDSQYRIRLTSGRSASRVPRHRVVVAFDGAPAARLAESMAQMRKKGRTMAPHGFHAKSTTLFLSEDSTRYAVSDLKAR